MRGSVRREPLSISDKMQSVYDLIAPLVWGLIEGHHPLFAHLLLQSKSTYQLVTFQILQDGSIALMSTKPLDDPSQIGLPSALELGFVARRDS